MRLTQFAMRFDTYRIAWLFQILGQSVTNVRLLAMPVLLGILACSGCANMQEKRTITAFQAGLDSGDLNLLRENASDQFAHKALRHPQSAEALDQLKLPNGDFEILEVEDVSDTEKKVAIGFGKDNKRKIMYRLVNEGQQKQWKVDDIYLRQRIKNKTVAMPVTNQMDVLLSSREFFDSWSQGNRQKVLNSCNPEMKQALEKLPPSVLAYNISLIIGKSERTKTFRPEAHINGDQAVVKLNRSHGTIQISMDKSELGWQVSDLALTGRNKDSRIDSLLSRVKVTNQTLAFLDAWQQNDKSKLQQVTQNSYYTAGLAPARLSDVPLPSSFDVEGKIDVKLTNTRVDDKLSIKRADVILNNQLQTLQITLKETKSASGDYKIEDVILYDMEQDQTLSLVSALTARPVAELFMTALNQRDAKMLRYNTTRDFQMKTWERASDQTLAILPIPVAKVSSPRVIETKFQGEVTHVVFEVGPDQLTVVLHDQGGRVLVDDVMIHSENQRETTKDKSLKDHLAAIIPVYELAASIHHGQPKHTVRLVTDDFYGRVFSLAKKMPETAYTYLDHVSASKPVVKLPGLVSRTQKNKKTAKHIVIEFDSSDKKETLVTFAGPNSEMQISLIEEDGLLRINDAVITGHGNQVAVQLKQTMRMELSKKRSQNMVRTVSGEENRTSSFRHQSTPPMQMIPRTKSLNSFGTNSPMPATNDAGISGVPDMPLQNALYEEYESQLPPQQIEQTKFSPPAQGLLPANRRSSRPLSPAPARHQIEDHLLLKQIPIQ